LAPKADRGPDAVPDFLLVGAKRCGTTSLFDYLTAQPDVVGPRASKGTHYFDVNHGRGASWYRRSFPGSAFDRRRRGERVVIGEASPYYLFHPLAADRIAAELPDVRLIAILRDPVDRAWSHYRYEAGRGFEDLSFEEAVELEHDRLSGEGDKLRAGNGYESFHHRHHSYLARGRYAEQLEPFLAKFPPERILLVQSEAFYAKPRREVDRVRAHLGLPTTVQAPRVPLEVGGPVEMDGDIRQWLVDYFQPHNERLYRLPVTGFRWDRER
jgi:hypothetical protein